MLNSVFLSLFRTFARNKATAIINIVGLSVSIACCIFVYAFIHHEHSFDSSQPNARNLYRVVSETKTPNGLVSDGNMNFAIARALRNDFPQLKGVTQVYSEEKGIVAINGKQGERKKFEEKGVTYADKHFLKLFKYEFLAGAEEKQLVSPDGIIITKELAQKYFGAESKSDFNDIIGKTIEVNRNSYTVSGVLENVPSNTNVYFNMLLPLKAFERIYPGITSKWNEVWGLSYTFVLLPDNYSKARLEQLFEGFKKKYLDQENHKKIKYFLQPLAEVHSDERYGGTIYATPKILVIAFTTMGIIVLITACINFINLATAQAIKRAKEVGIRKTLGSSKVALIRKFILEAFVLVVISSLVGLFIAQQFIKTFNDYLSFVIDFGLRLDTTVFYFLLALVVITTLLAGFYPAKVMANYNPIEALKSSIHAKNAGFAGRISLRKILVVVQFTFSQVLIIGTIVVAMQMRYLNNLDLGYTKDGIVAVEIPENNKQKLQSLRNEWMAISDVQEVSFSSGPPASVSNSFAEFRLPSQPENQKIGAERKFVDPEFLSTYNLKLLEGRNLLPTDSVSLKGSAAKYNILLNETSLSALGFKSAKEAVGSKVLIDKGEEATVVGVVKDFYNVSPHEKIKPCFLFYGTNWIAVANIKLQSAGRVSKNTMEKINEAWERTFPDAIYNSVYLDDYIRRQGSFVIQDIMFQAFKIFVFLSILIGCIGLYGLISYLALQREKEIGIRKVLGSSVNEIVMLFSKEFSKLIIVAFMISAPIAYLAMGTWLQSFANKIDIHPLYFVTALFISFTIAAITIGSQTFKAALTKPVRSLKAE